MKQYVILVDQNGRQTGLMEKLEAHQKGLLHSAFSIIILNHKKEWLLQKRAAEKYHSGGLWTNTCCSHPQENEPVVLTAQKRLKEEMGFSVPLKKIFSFIYKAEFENGLTEHEFDDVYFGRFDGIPIPNPDEVSDYCWKPYDQIQQELNENPEKYTPWFKLIVEHPAMIDFMEKL